MRKRILVSLLSAIFLLNSIPVVNPVYAANSVNVQEAMEMQNHVTETVIYLEDGEGALSDGKGTKDSPYQNIRTALKNIQAGQTLKLIGEVKYTKYEQHTDGSAKPLVIDKAIILEGNDESSGLMLRTTIQLGADVTFRNMKLQLIPEVTLGRVLGQAVERSNTIYAAGHSLTLDNVNTMLNSSSQASVRPYISGGAHRTMDKVGKKAVIKVINPCEETKIAAIYAGDYWVDRKMDVEVHLNAKLIDPVLYTGGVNGELNGNVEVNLYNRANLLGFNRYNHSGAVNVKVEEEVFVDTVSFVQVDEVVLENKAKIMVPQSGVFDVEKVTLKKEAVLDFRQMSNSPSIAGDFVGCSNVGDAKKAGAILLNNKQTLQIGGSVSGLTRLNSNGVEYMERFLDGHEYICAQKAGDGTFSIEGTSYRDYEIQKKTERGSDVWVVSKKKADELDKFGNFAWQGGNDQIVKPQSGDEFLYPVQFYKMSGSEYLPDMHELGNDYVISLERVDGRKLDLEEDVFVDWNYDREEDEPVQIVFAIYNLENVYGDLRLTVKHVESGKKIERSIAVLEKEEVPSVKPTEIAPSVKPTDVSPSTKPTAAPSTKPASIKLNMTKATLYTTGSSMLQLKATVVGTSNVVKYISENSKIAKVDKYGKVTAVGAGTVKIKAEANGITAYCTVIVKKTVLKLNVDKATIYTAAQKTVQIKPTIVGVSQKAAYASSDTKVAKVDKYGKVTAVKAGTVVITVKANGLTKKCTITVRKPELKISKTSLTVSRGKKATISAKAAPKGTITFTSNNKKLVTVNKQGVVTGVKSGTATITVKCNGITKKVTVKVK
nr:Ig-like domain-containing protein [uncultured Lachnoclostridium sp.]